MSDPSRAGATADSAQKEPDAERAEVTPQPLTAEDFYYENGLMVFTAAYHRKRGYCCNSGCRHCPFR
jgi:hypothetical protein